MGLRGAVGVSILWAALCFFGCGDSASPPSLDQQLAQVLREAGIGPLDPGPSPPPAKVALGQALMFDKELSGNRDIACATCHHPLLHTGDGLPLSIGTGGRGLGPARVRASGRPFIPRNAPEIFNRGAPEWRTMFWDMRVAGAPAVGFATPARDLLPRGLESVLAAQAMFPVTSRDEMRGQRGDRDVFGRPNELAEIPDGDLRAIWDALMARLLAIPGYVSMFLSAYPETPLVQLGFQHAANAIAAFEVAAWTLVDSPWDRYLEGDLSALPDEAKRGALLFFGKAGCARCHSGPLFTDQRAHNIGAPQIGPGKGAEAPEDFGRARETGEDAERFAFRTPPLRNVALTGPWMHDGAFATLEAAVRHHLDPARSLRSYDVSQLPPELRETFRGDPASIRAILQRLDPAVSEPLELSDREVNQLLTFLEALTDPRAADLREDIPASVPSGLPIAD